MKDPEQASLLLHMAEKDGRALLAKHCRDFS